VLVVEALASAPLPGRRRRRPAPSETGETPPELPLTRVTAVRAGETFGTQAAAEEWLRSAVASDEALDATASEGIAVLNRALFANAVSAADPGAVRELVPADAEVVRIGYGSGEEVAGGRYSEALRVDVRASGASRRRQRAERLRPQQRVAAVLGGRERIDACEPLLLRARADLDAGRPREATLQLSVALQALAVELEGAVPDPGHAEDMAVLSSRRAEVAAAADAAIRSEPGPDQVRIVRELLELAERVLRRRRVLRGD
jgi:hypothetical protein